MVAFKHLKSKNPVLKVIYGIINFITTFIGGLINLFINFGKWCYKSLIKSYKYEFLYIAVVAILGIVFSILGLTGFQNDQLISVMSHIHPAIYIVIISILGLIAVGGLTGYVLTIFKGKKIDDKYFWIVRGVSYFVTLVLLFFITDLVILDFISRFQTVKKPTGDTSSYDTMVYFLKEYKLNFWEGVKVTVSMALLGTLIGLILALGMVALRMLTIGPRDNDFVKFLKKIGSGFANIYVTVIRGTPMIVQAFIFYYLILGIVRPTMSIEEYRYFTDFVWTPFRAGLFTVSINTTAYLTEVLRGGINSVDKGQREAAEALGLGKFKTMMLIIFPQSIKNSLPSIGNEFIINIKDTSVLTLIGVLDLFSVGKNDILGIFQTKSLEAYLLVAVVYLILTYCTAKILNYIEVRMNMPVKGITSSN